jgi:CDK-activating kinase assembly factor MAT1
MEREVDIRRRIAQVYNREADEFVDLKSYNDYLNDVEDVTFNLIHGIDVETMEKQLRDYEVAHKEEISARMKRAKKGVQTAQARQAAEREEAHQKRVRALQDQQALKMEKIAAEREIVNKLASGGDATEIARQSEIAIRNNLAKRKEAMAEDFPEDNLFKIKGLKEIVEAEPEGPYDPFGGMSIKKSLFALQDDYGWNIWPDHKAPFVAAGGYELREFQNRALCEAFGGLGIIIGES